jgi:hypothetical protein
MEGGEVANSARRLPTPDPPRPPNDGEKTHRKAYLDALAKGRAATAARRYDEAVAAFGLAVENSAGFGGARAYAERGYAKLLAKHYDAALQDLEEAANQPSDAKLAAQVWFNRGLADEALGGAKDAELSFYRSNRLSPSKVAEERLAGKKVCPVTVDRTRLDARAYDGWFAWWRALNDTVDRDGAQELERGWGYFPPPEYPPKNESQAHQLYCPSCAGDGPWYAWFGGSNTTSSVRLRARRRAERRDGGKSRFRPFAALVSAASEAAPGSSGRRGTFVSFRDIGYVHRQVHRRTCPRPTRRRLHLRLLRLRPGRPRRHRALRRPARLPRPIRSTRRLMP